MRKEEVGGALNTEYVRNLNCNYERILLDKKPEEKRYQYCILSRGGIKGLLPCSLRYINGVAYLYYDISSKQNVAQLYGSKSVSRVWVVDFLWSMRQIRQELERFLLDSRNLIWRPEQIFQDLESHVFSFLYVPYYEGDSGYLRLMEFLIDHIDYEDTVLVECVYSMYEQLERNGEVYLQTQIYEDAKRLEEQEPGHMQEPLPEEREAAKMQGQETEINDICAVEESDRVSTLRRERAEETVRESMQRRGIAGEEPEKEEKKGIRRIFENRKKRGRELREEYRQTMRQEMECYAVVEETDYEGELYGRTVFMDERASDAVRPHRLLTPEGRLLATLDRPVFSIGKKKEEADLVLEHPSVSRIHARIVQEKADVYLEDLNSTNGTYKNGLRMQPYEKRKLEEGDEIKCGTVILIFA